MMVCLVDLDVCYWFDIVWLGSFSFNFGVDWLVRLCWQIELVVMFEFYDGYVDQFKVIVLVGVEWLYGDWVSIVNFCYMGCYVYQVSVNSLLVCFDELCVVGYCSMLVFILFDFNLEYGGFVCWCVGINVYNVFDYWLWYYG